MGARNTFFSLLSFIKHHYLSVLKQTNKKNWTHSHTHRDFFFSNLLYPDGNLSYLENSDAHSVSTQHENLPAPVLFSQGPVIRKYWQSKFFYDSGLSSSIKLCQCATTPQWYQISIKLNFFSGRLLNNDSVRIFRQGSRSSWKIF